jgi:hypothetical protein
MIVSLRRRSMSLLTYYKMFTSSAQVQYGSAPLWPQKLPSAARLAVIIPLNLYSWKPNSVLCQSSCSTIFHETRSFNN